MNIAFWNRVKVTANPELCWDWNENVASQNGYGRIHFQGRRHLTHRIAYFLTHGQWPEPYCLHSCDNRRCCNPAHLREGTIQDNTADMLNRDRQAKGDKIACVKLTVNQVVVIKQMLIQGHSSYKLGEQYGVRHSTIHNISRGVTWKYVEPVGDIRHLILPRIPMCYAMKDPRTGRYISTRRRAND